MISISRDTPCFFLTAVTKDRLPVFRTDALAGVACAAIDEARRSGGFSLLAYVLMPNHIHAITDGSRRCSDMLRFIKGIVSRRVIRLPQGERARNVARHGGLRHEPGPRSYRYSVWQHHSNAMLLTSESVLMQRVNYIHLNPVRDGLVERADEYQWSSYRFWRQCRRENEPLVVDMDQIRWRRA